MITSSGARCDICGHYILPLSQDERVHFFGVHGIDRELHCDNACKKLLQEIVKDDWEKLPDGPLRKVFQEAHEKLKAVD